MTSEKKEYYFSLKYSFSDDYTITKFNYIVYIGENGKWSLNINVSA